MDEAFPMRINKYLALQGRATRREADALISAGAVRINGRTAVLGDKVEKADTVEVGSRKRAVAKHYFSYHKPRGIITHSPQGGEMDIGSQLPPEVRGLGLFPVGRLDKASHGLIILTNDGRVTDRLLNPERAHDKEYQVKVKFPLRVSFKERLERGIDIEGYTTKPAQVRQTGEQSFSITITEGKKHQIRRMVVALHNEVVDLKRVRILNIRLGKLAAGAVRPIEGAELSAFLKRLGLAGD